MPVQLRRIQPNSHIQLLLERMEQARSHVLLYSILTCFGVPVLGGTASAYDV